MVTNRNQSRKSAGWLHVFLKDMACLPETHPSVHEGLMERKFVVQRSEKKFSLMTLDPEPVAQHQVPQRGQRTKRTLWTAREGDN
ncbi:hypothetical protein Pmani_031259 [Petrolisthes manimaculis]|uniref:Uncharacterized protein n=1 Tax=Petrolisthes manimaculis TaxID=1843537 RepID=A0AAE1NWB6_9EUCA|nr:hypothetical protein Pmani_031259 [Petrolisthes manimaculis]